MYVKRIKLVNYKVLEDIEFDFVNAVYLIKGKNEIGKTTLINAIVSHLTGERSDNLLKKGTEKGYSFIIVGDDKVEYKSELKFTKANPRGTLSIQRVGEDMKSNKISALQSIFNYHDFDANEFVILSKTAEGRRKQVEIVRSLLSKEINEKIDALDKQYKETYDKRTQDNSELKMYDNIIKKDPLDVPTPEKYKKKKDVNLLNEKKRKGDEFNLKYDKAVEGKKEIDKALENFDSETDNGKEDLQQDIINYQSLVTDVEKEIELKKQKLADLKKEMKAKEAALTNYDEKRNKEKSALENRQTDAKEYFDNNEKVDIDEILTEIKEVESFNDNCDKVKTYNENLTKMNKAKKAVDSKSLKLHKLKIQKTELVKNSKLPIEGLTFDEDGLFLNEIPYEYDEIATSQKMKVACKLVIAANPTVNIFKMLQGESLDEDNVKAVVEFGKDEGFQGFIEEVERGQDKLTIEQYAE